MQRCPHCGWPADGHDCPHCVAAAAVGVPSGRDAAEVADSAADDWQVVARFGNAAEAGYFANELEYAIDCEPRLEQRDDFDPVHHFWRTSYVLSVPDDHADTAVVQLRRILDGEPIESSAAPAARVASSRLAGRAADAMHDGAPDDDANGESGINWVPIVLTIAAGSLVLWAGKKAPPLRRPAPPDDALRVDFWDALGRDRAPWVQRSETDGVRELVIDAATGHAVLREDRDGDGQFEHEVRYATGKN